MEPTKPARLDRDVLIQIVGYSGAAVGLASTFAALARAEDLTEAGALVAMLVVTAALVGAGALISGAEAASHRRMHSVLWFVGVQTWGIAVQLLVSSVLELTGRTAAVAAAVLVLAGALVLWVPLRRTLQHLWVFSGVLGLVFAVTFPEPAAFVPPDPTATLLLMWAVSLVWVVLGVRAILAPPRAAMVVGSISGILTPLLLPLAAAVSLVPETTRVLGEVLSFLTAAGVLALGERSGDRALQGLGIVGVLLAAGVLAGDHLLGTDAGTLAGLVLGIGLLAAALAGVRMRGAGPAAPSPPAVPGSVPEPPAGA